MQTLPVVSKPNSPDSSTKRSQFWLVRRWQYYLHRLKRLRGGKKKIARGLAVGVFAGFFPLFGLQTLLGVLLATVVRGNKFAAAAATWISNPLTYVPIYAFNFHIGAILLRIDQALIDIDQISVTSSDQLLELGSALILTLLVGCLINGLIAGIGTYFLSLWFYNRLQDNRRSRLTRRKQKSCNNQEIKD